MGTHDITLRDGESVKISDSNAGIDKDSKIVQTAFFDGNKDSVIVEFD